MINEICRRITQKLIEKNIIDFEDHEIYMYGLQLFMATVFKGVGIFTIAYVLGLIKETIVFLVAFSTLRVNAGGYHSSTYFRCFIVTILAITVAIVCARYMALYDVFFVTIALLIISILLILQYAPVDTPNKRLKETEVITYRRRSILIVVLESLITIATYILKREFIIYCNIVTIAILVESLSIMPFISKSKNRRKEYESKEV